MTSLQNPVFDTVSSLILASSTFLHSNKIFLLVFSSLLSYGISYLMHLVRPRAMLTHKKVVEEIDDLLIAYSTEQSKWKTKEKVPQRLVTGTSEQDRAEALCRLFNTNLNPISEVSTLSMYLLSPTLLLKLVIVGKYKVREYGSKISRSSIVWYILEGGFRVTSKFGFTIWVILMRIEGYSIVGPSFKEGEEKQRLGWYDYKD
ncbi:hypothetical protein TREMEDRAFT_64425 [Tremella mesenterica DSM 1558]|uniref:uncharacterized protein n=1 Tax=Tremella mesenterica (strain ATCC 24925 / CBS 8224 / DSM 1558 / NBRC 9311 / NRRL Y-6157 / RJB 2259-6 / UBC 559-6) TaxID=578456 RepID=UPI0003F48EA6|nr:uncharacterized protein TREMEDRAFT_64425 [Tremella mesenterica DSM 1558]EIW67185.1 hypothetical protein TREMEDRAFT_64425 [Tremella mesenterica DSM 1558]